MRAVTIVDGRFELRECPEPVLQPDQVLIGIRSAGLNAADLQQARGDYPAPAGWPADIPGLEVAGEVLELGSAVRDVRVGDRVMALVGGGGHAERIAVPADLLLPVPGNIPWEHAGGFPEAFSTAWDALVTQAGIAAGDQVLITGAAGGIGTAMVQIAAVSGADVVASVRRTELHGKVAALPAESGRLDVVTPEREIDHGPFDIIVELVGGDSCLDRVELLRTGGRLLVVGVQGGMTAPLKMFDLMLKRARLIGTTIRGRSPAEKALLAHGIRTHVVPLLAQERIQVPIEATYEIHAYDEAYARLSGPGKFGKIVLIP
ncbi:zinc-binding dehydrogenase [Saccharopolyspora sp. NPDC050642]|uniref:alcohol dehydrogenase catalytic domain-containing protein n=1 Tax=Saccharopolyspora sp. NPDC050642 TaxID=3157099 RepID=UPI0034091DE9